MIYIKRYISESTFTFQEKESPRRMICNGQIFSDEDNLEDYVKHKIASEINAGNIEIIPFVPDTLDEIKAGKIAAIDLKTSDLIKAGFEYDGSNFSMSDAAQRNWCAMAAAKANGLISYPLTLTTVDEGYHQIADATALTLFLVAYLTYQTDSTKPLAAGRILKSQVNACETVEAVNAIEDNR